jgi:polysaccharide pyruvyl transferase WcaK-like protein
VAKLFARHALRAAAYVSFRDRESQTLTREVGFLGQSDVLPDSVYSLEIPAIRRDPSQTVAKSVVGLSPKLGLQALQMPESKSPAACGDFVETLARFACWLDGKSYLLALFGTDIGEDPLAVKDLETAIRKRRNGTAMVSSGSYAVTSLDDLLSAMAAMDYVVTCRFHGIIFAHLLNKPVLAISPHPKVKTLMKDLDLASYCVDARECDLHRLTDAFAALVSNADAIRTRMAERLSSYRSQLAVQFDELFPGTAQ